MDNSDLIELIKLSQNRDVKAFEQIYDEYAKATYFIAFKLLQNKQNAEEVTQDVFIYVYKKISDLKDPQAFTVWINKITANKCTDLLRKNNQFTVDIDEIAESEFIEEYDPKLIPEKSLDNEATAQIIIKIIDNLSLPQRVCVYYYYYQHLTVKEIAEQLEIKETTVKNRLALARDKIRKELEKLEDNEGIRLYSVFPLFLIPLLKAAAENSEVPHGVLSKVLLQIGAETAAASATGATGTATAAAKAGIGLKTIIAAIAGVALTGGIVAGVVLLNSKPEAADTAQNNTGIVIDATTEQFATEADNVTIDTSSIWLTFNDITDEKLVEMVADGTIPQNVTALDLTNSKLTDISPLSSLTSLTVLKLGGNPIRDLSPLSSLTNLHELNLHGVDNETQEQTWKIDLSPLSNLTDLTYLDFDNTWVTNVSALSGLTNLTNLTLDNNQLIDLAFLSKLTNLKYLDISSTLPYDIGVDISPLRNLTKLETLFFSGCGISDISYLENMPNLKTLFISSNNITDISVLSKLTKLTSLDISGNKIEDISSLNKLPELEMLFANGNNISDLSPLFELTKLTDIDIRNNPTDEAQVAELKTAFPDCVY